MTGSDIWRLSLESPYRVEALVRTKFSEGNAAISPDGKWMAFQSNRTGRFEVYVTSYPNVGQETQVSTAGGGEPTWGKDGELFYRNSERFMAVSLTFGTGVSAGEPRVLFSKRYFGPVAYSRVRDRFSAIRENDQDAAGKSLNLVLGWFGELSGKGAPR